MSCSEILRKTVRTSGKLQQRKSEYGGGNVGKYMFLDYVVVGVVIGGIGTSYYCCRMVKMCVCICTFAHRDLRDGGERRDGQSVINSFTSTWNDVD